MERSREKYIELENETPQQRAWQPQEEAFQQRIPGVTLHGVWSGERSAVRVSLGERDISLLNARCHADGSQESVVESTCPPKRGRSFGAGSKTEISQKNASLSACNPFFRFLKRTFLSSFSLHFLNLSSEKTPVSSTLIIVQAVEAFPESQAPS
ncbi:hypothetical protein LR48_Vigan10g070000 [Vigna angularis]|uniref:Uncharacterized protein n=1 Tax=Phaseolus angularis TaxID=3914 RepID=A0A0L9VIJ6_PHAAN|nr:hypothetical protein LR48_Vigan10g070000 [Vigna angularis]